MTMIECWKTALHELEETNKIADGTIEEIDKSKTKIAEASWNTKEITGNTDVVGRHLNNVKKRSGFMGFLRGLGMPI